MAPHDGESASRAPRPAPRSLDARRAATDLRRKDRGHTWRSGPIDGHWFGDAELWRL